MDSGTVSACLLISIGLLYAIAVYLVREIYHMKHPAKEEASNRLVHLGTGMEPLKEFTLSLPAGIVIGRDGKGDGITPDFDLSPGDAADAVAKNHAVMNRIEGCWYIEALESQYQVGIKKAGESVVYRLKTWFPYKVEPGDIIYIARERLLFK